eukprot:05519.XXX_67454_67776_1 [CDS] Oithona nana genome sequencing.
MNLASRCRILTSSTCQAIKSSHFPPARPFVCFQSKQFPQHFCRTLKTTSVTKMSDEVEKAKAAAPGSGAERTLFEKIIAREIPADI